MTLHTTGLPCKHRFFKFRLVQATFTDNTRISFGYLSTEGSHQRLTTSFWGTMLTVESKVWKPFVCCLLTRYCQFCASCRFCLQANLSPQHFCTLQVKYPENFFLLRGNHECASINRIYGFYDECKRRYNIRLWKTFTDCFNCLPVAALVDEKV